MQSVFLVLGYGVPADILQDEHYQTYLSIVFNTIYNMTRATTTAPVVICCGGKTDMIKPYRRTEADEMVRFFTSIVAERLFLQSITAGWKFVPERQSISTLENILRSKAIVEKRRLKPKQVVVFCEATRVRRVRILLKKIWGTATRIRVIGVDFDRSLNRYLSPAFLAKKESTELRHALWALQSPANLKRHHALFAGKLKHLRALGPNAHPEAIKEWWEHQLAGLSTP